MCLNMYDKYNFPVLAVQKRNSNESIHFLYYHRSALDSRLLQHYNLFSHNELLFDLFICQYSGVKLI